MSWRCGLSRKSATYTHSLWITYQQFQSIDAQVRKGEKATLIIFEKEYDVEPDPARTGRRWSGDVEPRRSSISGQPQDRTENDFRRRKEEMRDDVEINAHLQPQHGQKEQESDKDHHALVACRLFESLD